MRYACWSFMLAALLLLGGCSEAQDDGSPPVRYGRYAGIGTYPADELWSHLAAAARPADKAAATIEDDGQIIVLVDTVTGEVRQCGNLSGICVGMNPWTGALAATRAAPVPLTAHAADLAREPEVVNQADPAPLGDQADEAPKTKR